MRKIILFLIIILNIYPAHSYAISAKSAIVIDSASKRVLYEKNAYEKLPMASTTKIMTGLLACESGRLEEIVTVSPNASGTEGSSLWLGIGEKMSLENLTYGLMLRSGNDAAVAIAEHLAGCSEAFAAMMTVRARDIGAMNTRFQNPNGLDAEGHYTTAYDLALISRFAMKNKKFAQIVATKNKTIPWEGSKWDRSLKNHNKMLWRYEGCNGIKTGFTKKCGRCLVTSAKRGDEQYICVTLNAPSDWEDHTQMLDDAFATYETKTVFPKNAKVTSYIYNKKKGNRVPLVCKEGYSIAVKENENITTKIEYVENVKNIKKGETGAKVHIFLNNTEIDCIDLVFSKTISKNSFVDRLFKRY
ncbi:MAG: D-alanyl-D-alanine carboxypeptidase family protein [Clostridia bacterium]|nr:D-alanyl-D-alanine carboxypeptidase family protein [Clostridia bacterium]